VAGLVRSGGQNRAAGRHAPIEAGEDLLKRILIALGIVVAGVVISCRYLLPERFAVNAPIAQMLFGGAGEKPEAGEMERLEVPPGFSIALWAEGIQPTARFLRFTETGDLLVSTPRSGAIVLLERDSDGDRRSDGQRVLLDGLNRPHGVELRDGWLYVGEADAIARVRFDAARREVTGQLERVVTGLPGGGNHWTKTLRFGPDGWLYMHVGSTCNACVEDDKRRATIMRFRPDGSDGEIYASGLRNSVGFDWQPGTGDLYATDNGRDLLGDGFPPCELNRIVKGGFYGWPVANGNRVPDPDLGEGQEARIAASIPPAHPFRAHNAPLGMTFVRGSQLPAEYRHAAIVALHGSWNRREKDGYRVVSLHFDGDRIEERDFATGFETDGDVIGRPVDVAEGPDGAIYVSDDFAGVVWRIAYGEAAPAASELQQAKRSGSLSDPLADLAANEREALAAEGAALYDTHGCAVCHEPDRAPAGTAVKLLENLASRYSVESLVLLIEAPPQPMPTPTLTPEQRRALAVHLLSVH
jgi:glucose/arabinose dehydrogenase